ncbi:MAG: PAS domain-containing protein [bacterium]|nr:PAS domain-containing protein [bacterium]
MDRLELLRDLLDRAQDRLEGMQTDWQRFDAILEALPAAIFVAAPEPPFAVRYISPSVFPLTGWTPAQYVGDPRFWWDRVHPDDGGALGALSARLEAGGTVDLVYRLAHATQGWRWVQGIMRLLRAPDGRAQEFVGVAYYLGREPHVVPGSDGEAAPHAAQLAMIAHEIRNPLHAMAGALDALTGVELPEAARPWVAVLARGLDAALGVASDTLDTAMLDAGRLRIETRRLDVAALLRDVALLCGQAADRAGLTLRTTCDPAACVGLLGDPNRLRQVLVNLVQNALRFTVQGGVTVHAALACEPPSAPTVLELAVVDTGPGFGEAQRARLFEPFAAPPGVPAHGVRGTGLGLAITRRLVAAMGGTIAVDSVPGAGSRVVVRVPALREGLQRA